MEESCFGAVIAEVNSLSPPLPIYIQICPQNLWPGLEVKVRLRLLLVPFLPIWWGVLGVSVLMHGIDEEEAASCFWNSIDWVTAKTKGSGGILFDAATWCVQKVRRTEWFGWLCVLMLAVSMLRKEDSY